MSAHVIMKLLNKMGKRDKMGGFPLVSWVRCGT